MEDKDYITRQKNEREIEEAKIKQRKNRRLSAIGIVWLAASLGCLFGGMFSGLSWLVITALVLLFGGAFLLSVFALGDGYIKDAKRSVAKYGGSIKPYVYKGIVLLLALISALAFGVLGFVLSEYYFIGTIASFFIFIIIVFAWHPGI